MSSEELALTWDDHHNTLVGVFRKLLETSTLVDCTIAAEGRYLRAHKIILSACSPYFEMLFSQENEKNPIVVLKDIKFQELQAMIDFIYSGKVKVPEDRLGDFVDAAESLQIKGLGGDNYQRNNSGKERLSHHLTRKEDCASPVPHKRSKQTFLSASEESVGEISSATNVSENTNNENVSHQMQVEILDSLVEQNSCIASTTSCSAAFSTSVLSNQISSSSLESVLPIPETVVVKTEPEPIAEIYLPDFKAKDEETTEDILGLDSSGDVNESVVDVNSQHATNQYSGPAACFLEGGGGGARGACAGRQPALRVRPVRPRLPARQRPGRAPPPAHGRKALPLRRVRRGVRLQQRPAAPQARHAQLPAAQAAPRRARRPAQPRLMPRPARAPARLGPASLALGEGHPGRSQPREFP